MEKQDIAAIYDLAEKASCVSDVAKYKDTNTWFWLFETKDDVNKFTQICKEYLRQHNMDEGLFSDEEYFNAVVEESWGYTDEFYKCDQCLRIYPWEEHNMTNYFRDEDLDDLWCPDCIEKYPETYIDFLVENGNIEDEETYNQFLSDTSLAKHGFQKLDRQTKFEDPDEEYDIIYSESAIYIRKKNQ